MGTLSRSESKHMYSWWWDSHISPKNSRWLKENLTDMDSKVRQMIKLIEVDEDSFARRADMYFKRRPELMKLVEEFYRAYRALAERYDHATGVIRQAHRTMEENQIQFVMDDGSAVSVSDSDPCTPELPPFLQASFDPDELHDNAVGISPPDFHLGRTNGAFTVESDSSGSREGLKQLPQGRARKGLNFHDVEEKERSTQNNEKPLSESERLGNSEMEIWDLKEALAKLEAEKEAGLLQYQQSLERLSNLESEVSRAQQDSKGSNQRASKAEAEVSSLKEALVRLEAEREASLLQYQQSLDTISNSESSLLCSQEDAEQLHERACKAEKEAEALREEFAQLKDEKEASLAKYMEALEKIANLENKLLLAEDSVSRANEQADIAEKEVEALMQAVARLMEEKEAAALQYQQCLEKISILEHELALVQEEAKRLKVEVNERVAELKGAEEQCLLLERSNKSMQLELGSLMHKVGAQNEELSEKQKELGRLWTCVQEEHLRFKEAEAAFRALHTLHSQTQEELRSVAGELQKRIQLLKEMEIQNQNLQVELENCRDENKCLNDLQLSSAFSIKSMQDEVCSLTESKAMLEGELELRLDQRNALQQEIYGLKEELNDLSKQHKAVLEQLESVGFEPLSFGSSVKGLQVDNLKLKESCQKSEAQIAALIEKLGEMQNLLEKNALLENSLSNLSAELEGAREKVRALEDSCQLLMAEKSTVLAEKATLISQLELTTENLAKLSERNSSLENSLFDANAELEAFRVKSKNVEDSCRLLDDAKSVLVIERQMLASELETAHQRLDELGKRHAELEQKHSVLEEERESSLRTLEELRALLDVEKQEHANLTQLSRMRMADMENQIRLLQQLNKNTNEELVEELDKGVTAQFEIFILRKYVLDLKEKSSSLLIKCEKVLEASKLSEKVIAELEHENLEQQEEVSLLSDQIKRLRMGMFRLLKELEVDGLEYEDIVDEDQMVLHHILTKLDETKSSLCRAWDENEKLVIEQSVLVTLLEQLKNEVAYLKTVINNLSQEFRTGNEQLSLLQKHMKKLLESNEELLLRVREGSHREAVHAAEMKNLWEKLLYVQLACKNLEKEKFKILEEKSSLMKTVVDLEEEEQKLEQENSCLLVELVALDSLYLIFENIVLEKSVDMKELSVNVERHCSDKNVLQAKMRTMEEKLEEVQMKNRSLEATLKDSENELKEVRAAKGQLEDELENGKSMLYQKEREVVEAEAVKDKQGRRIVELSEKYEQQLKGCQRLQDSIQSLEAEINQMHEEHEEAEIRTGALQMELQKEKAEVELWETVAVAFFSELQTSSVQEALFKDKLSELSKVYNCLDDESYSKGVEIVELKAKVGALEGENCEMKAQLDSYFSAIAPLRDSVASLENCTASHAAVDQMDNEEKKDAESCQSFSENKVALESNNFGDLREMQTRIKAIEKAVVEIKSLAEEERSNASSKLEAAMRQIEVLRTQGSSCHRSTRSSQRFALQPGEEHWNSHPDGWKQRKLGSDAYDAGDELLMKDITLDKASESSSYKNNRRNIAASDDQILELWETIDVGGCIDLADSKSHKAAMSPNKKYSLPKAVKEQKSGHSSPQSLVEKELGIDKQQTSKGFDELCQEEESKKNILARLDSDVQKLTNLQITVQDLKKKVEITENAGRGRSIEYDNVKEQLEETEKAILKLIDANGKLVKNVESSSSSFDGLPTMNFSEGGIARGRKVSEQARRCSEKIGMLQLEVQKIQFLLLKLDGDKVGRSGVRVAEPNNRVLLRDYLHGEARTPRWRRARFCSCVRPPTIGD
ncbi:hypothetical protein Ancab_020050 [Ancistrocladus abbreviatus]